MTDRRALAVIVALHLAMIAIVQPRGEFPLNDDWAYAHSVQWLLAEGRIRLSEWVAMNLLPQTLAGASVSLAFGFSFEALRHLTQAAALLALMAAFAWFRGNRLDSASSLVAVTALAAFPAWPVLANSYMTDVYGLLFALPAATLFLRALESPSATALVAATLLSVVGVLQRQVVLVIPFAFLVASLWMRPQRNILAALGPFVLTLLAAAAYHAYLQAGPGVPEGHRLAYGRLWPMAMKALTNQEGMAVWALSNLVSIGGYLGFFSVGWLLWAGLRGRRSVTLLVIAVGIGIALAAFAFDWFPPYRAMQVIDRAGIGPFLLHDVVRGAAPIDRSAGLFWRGLAIPAAVGTSALLVGAALVTRRLWHRDVAPALVFNSVAIAAYLVPFIVTDYFDRYLLFILPFVFALWTQLEPEPVTPSSPSRRGVAIAWIAAVLLLSALATRDYFSWNRVRWDAIRMAERAGGNAESIDGGFEYNAYRRYAREVRSAEGNASWWFVADDRYIVSFSEVPGYEVVERWRVKRVLSRTPAEVLLLRRGP